MTTQDSLSCEVFLVELLEDVPEAYTDEVQTREPVTGGIVHGKFKSHHRKHAAKATDQDQEMRRSQSVLSIEASGFPITGRPASGSEASHRHRSGSLFRPA